MEQARRAEADKDGDMSDTLELAVRTFSYGTDKEVARKVPEEAAEAYNAWESDQRTGTNRSLADLADELADCITACCNLAARYDINLQAAIDRVEARNRERGRY